MTKECDLPKGPQPTREEVEDLRMELRNMGVQTYVTRRRRTDRTLGPPRFSRDSLEPPRLRSGPLELPRYGSRTSETPRFRNGAPGTVRFGIRDEEVTESDEDDDAGRLQCPSCDFEIDISAVRTRLKELNSYDPKDMMCPVCDETLVEYAMMVALKSNAEKSDKSSTSSGDSVVPVVPNVSGPNSSGIRAGEGSSSAGEGSSSAKGYGTNARQDSGDEQDIEEKKLKASFVQELVLSTLI